MGINANVAPEALGEDLRQPATSLRATLGRDVDLDRLIDDSVDRITIHLRALEDAGLTADHLWRLNDALAWRGQPVALQRGEQRIEGVLHGIDQTGRAIIGEAAYEAGEVTGLIPTSAT